MGGSDFPGVSAETYKAFKQGAAAADILPTACWQTAGFAKLAAPSLTP